MNMCVNSGTSLIQTHLGQMKESLLARFPDFRGLTIHKEHVMGLVHTANILAFIAQDSEIHPDYQGVPISGFHCIQYTFVHVHMYTCTCTCMEDHVHSMCTSITRKKVHVHV